MAPGVGRRDLRENTARWSWIVLGRREGWREAVIIARIEALAERVGDDVCSSDVVCERSSDDICSSCLEKNSTTLTTWSGSGFGSTLALGSAGVKLLT